MSFHCWVVVSVLVVGGCSSPEKPPARMLGQESQDSLAKIVSDPADERNATITFSPVPEELAEMKVGEIFVLPPTKPIARAGLMYRINSMTIAGDTLTIEGRQPPLTDLYKDDVIGTDKELTAEDIDMEATMADVLPGEGAMAAGLGPRPTPTFSVNWPRIDFHDDFVLCNGSSICSVDGHITLPHPFINVEMEFDLRGVRRTQFRVNVDAEIAIEIRGRVETPGIGSSVRLFTIHFTPIPIGVWVVFDPRLTIRLGAKAAVGLDVTSAGFSAGAHVTAGNEWVRDRGDLNLSTASATGTAHAEGLTQTTVQADIYSRAEFGFFMYYISGPYIYFEQGPRLNLASPHHPFAQVGYHIETGLGGRFDVIDESLISLADYSRAIFDLTIPLWSSSNSRPDINSFTPTAASIIVNNPNDPVTFSMDGYDVEDGAFTDAMVDWRSARDGVIGHAKTVVHKFLAGGPGSRTVYGRVTDSDGAMVERLVDVTVLSSPPFITITAPTATTVFREVAINVNALVDSAFYPNGDLCTASGSILRWSSSVAADTISPAAQSTCGGTITFHTTGARTLRFTATDRFNQTSFRDVSFTVVDTAVCTVTIESLDGTNVSNMGSVQSVRLRATPSLQCGGGFANWWLHSTANGGYHEKRFGPSFDVTYNPTTDLADDGSLMIKKFDTSPQTVTAEFYYDWDDGAGNTGVARPAAPITLNYQWQ